MEKACLIIGLGEPISHYGTSVDVDEKAFIRFFSRAIAPPTSGPISFPLECFFHF